ncbi:MAG TPA: TetR/AcrR family transcriptional regulator [Pseudonocardia sp.]|uniref:TetR/AcrR family transcriptional regulator n=1 Tax=Pseudonocardia sp. TaxID=60912 RepID=UPI002ED9D661
MLQQQAPIVGPVATRGETGGLRRRRRGQELHAAIVDAVLGELREQGYAGLTMDGVAARAQTGKATLYRRWQSKVELVVAALEFAMPKMRVPADRGDLRGELLDVLHQLAEEIGSPSGEAARGLIAELVRSPALAQAVRPFLADSVTAPTLEVLRRAAVRGEIPVSALTPRYASIGTDLLRQHALVNGSPVPDEAITEIVDGILLPLMRGLATT